MAPTINTRDIAVDQLATLEVFSETGEQTPLARLWQDTPAVLVFVRHFG